jgi:hypothetical protein
VNTRAHVCTRNSSDDSTSGGLNTRPCNAWERSDALLGAVCGTFLRTARQYTRLHLPLRDSALCANAKATHTRPLLSLSAHNSTPFSCAALRAPALTNAPA